MADSTNTTTEILKFEIEQGAAISEQEKLKAALVNLKQEATNLQKAYKDGSITLQEYASESVRVENTQKSLVNTYSNVQRSVTGLKNPIKELTESNKKLIESNEKIAESAKEQVKELNVAGVSIGDVSSKVAAFANPVTGAIAVVGLLTEAYKESAVGAQDLRSATDDIKATFDILSNQIGNGSGGGFFSKIVSGFTDVTAEAGQAGGKLAALAKTALDLATFKGDNQFFKDLKDIGKSLDSADLDAKIKDDAKKKLAELREIELEQIKLDKENADRKDAAYQLQAKRDDARNTDLAEKQGFAIKVVEQLEERTKTQNELDQKKIDKLQEYGVLTGQINKDTLVAYDQEGELNIKILKLETAISETRAANGRRITQAVIAEQRITDELEKQNKLLNTDQLKKYKYNAPKTGPQTSKQEDEINQLKETEGAKTDIVISDAEYRSGWLKLKADNDVADNKKREEKASEDSDKINQQTFESDQKLLNAKKDAQDLYIGYLGQTIGAAGRLAKQGTGTQRALASAAALISSYETAEKAASAVADVPYAGPGLAAAAFAAALAQGLAAVAQINGVTFSEGGYTGDGGKYKPAGIVHAGEVVWNQRDVAMAGGPTRANSLRPTYYNGGIVADAATSRIDQIQSNSFKNIPKLFVGVKEFVRVSDRVTAKEKATTL